jgi:hypothetical protein
MTHSRNQNVLIYAKGRRSSATVRRAYIAWRAQQVPPLPERCDQPNCVFHTGKLVWNGKPFKHILDHVNGVNGDNRPENLRFHCPNCNQQQPTHGGGNRGRVEQSAGGFALISRDGRKNYELPVEAGHGCLDGSKIEVDLS